MRVLDLFSGIGGFSLGLERAGMETVAFCELPENQSVICKHWPDVPIYDDVKELTYERLEADGITNIDVITGGFPCQDLSSAGSRRGIEGDRSGLWGELLRITSEVRPRFMLFENVSGLLTGDGGRWFSRLLSDLASIGFNLEWECIPASSIGAPHIRDRVYGVAYPSENGWLRIFPETNLTVRRDVGDNHKPNWLCGGAGSWSNWEAEVEEALSGQPYIAPKDDGVSHWVDENSFLGNSVVPEIPEIIGRTLMRAIK